MLHSNTIRVFLSELLLSCTYCATGTLYILSDPICVGHGAMAKYDKITGSCTSRNEPIKRVLLKSLFYEDTVSSTSMLHANPRTSNAIPSRQLVIESYKTFKRILTVIIIIVYGILPTIIFISIPTHNTGWSFH